MLKMTIILHANLVKKAKSLQHVILENIQDDTAHCKRYNNALLIPGMCHIDINITEAIFKILWQPCIKYLATILIFFDDGTLQKLVKI